MAIGELRRSTRARKQVKTYADELVEEGSKQIPRKRKRASTSQAATDDFEDSNDELASAGEATSSDHEDDDIKERTVKKTTPAAKKKASTVSGTGDWHASRAEIRVADRIQNVPRLAPGQQETRLLSHVADEDDLPDKYWSALKKATKEKMFVLERTRDVEHNCHANHDDCPCETLSIAGSKGSIYRVSISHLTTCTCPVGIFNKKGKESQCKHVIYVLHQVLRVAEHLKYQQAFLTSELKELFANAPQLPSQIAEESVKDGNRKEATGECPICFVDFEEDEDLVWCKAACGNNLHAECFKAWERSKNPVTCPFCRTLWQKEVAKNQSAKQKTTVEKVVMPTEPGKGGYLNVRDQLAYGSG